MNLQVNPKACLENLIGVKNFRTTDDCWGLGSWCGVRWIGLGLGGCGRLGFGVLV